jgi:hypothetical protein
MASTKIDAAKTAQEICAALVQAGAAQINQVYESRKLKGIRWSLPVEGTEVLFEMPARIEPVFRALQKQRSPRLRHKSEQADRDQAERVAWPSWR